MHPLLSQTKFGRLPEAAMQQLAEMLYNPSGQSNHLLHVMRSPSTRKRQSSAAEPDVRSVRLSRDIFLPEPRIIQPYTRMKMFKPDDFTMEGFKKAGSDMHLLDRIMNVIRNTKDHVQKVQLFDDYVRRVIRQHVSSVLNNELRSNHALYTVKYLEQGKHTSCRDLRGLIQTVMPRFYQFASLDPVASSMRKDSVYNVHGDAYAMEAACASYWRLNCPSTFVCYSWLMDDLLRYHNEHFFYLTAQNLKICNDAWVSMIQFRLGQHEDWCYMGMPTVICDAGCKLRKASTGFAGCA